MPDFVDFQGYPSAEFLKYFPVPLPRYRQGSMEQQFRRLKLQGAGEAPDKIRAHCSNHCQVKAIQRATEH